MSPISSPCVKLCILDGPSGLCQGCGRTLQEISVWASLSEPQRLAVMERLPGRLAASRTERRARAGRDGGRRRDGRAALTEASVVPSGVDP